LAGCAAPFGVRPASPEEVHRSLTANVLSTGDLSNFSRIMLHRRNLTDLFEDHPTDVLRRLHAELRAGTLSDEDLFSLAELSFHYAARKGGRPHYLAAALYGYAYVFAEDGGNAPSPFDPRLRLAMDLYNRSLTQAFKSPDSEQLDIAGGVYALPFGELEIVFDESSRRWAQRRLTHFTAAAELAVVGFQNRYRQPGIGAPLAAATEPIDPADPAHDYVGPNVRVPVTLLLRVTEPRRQILGERLTGELRLYAVTEGQTAEIDGRSVPLEQEPTASLALGLTAARPWTQDLKMFLGRLLPFEVGSTFGGREPHRRDRIPVVFVHGTASNFSVWANMVNDLSSDPVIARNFDFWFFRYDSGQPILYSGMLLRHAITEAAAAFQSDSPDPCVQQMVVIGHSQGGLLVKLTAIHSGDRFWRNASSKPFEEVEFSDETRAILRDTMFVEPLPVVRRVVFIATPHRGSYLAGSGIVRRLAQRLITLPATVAKGGVDLLSAANSVGREAGLQRLPTSIDNMWPGHPFITAISSLPVAPEVAAHSIIGVVDDGPVEEGGDGVVKYASAHIDGVESELVVPYPHSMQSQPEVVAEVQRILRHHLEVSVCADVVDEVAAPGTGAEQ
jgi:pimeloyl-ACP methyl ester carboxylesterase